MAKDKFMPDSIFMYKLSSYFRTVKASIKVGIMSMYLNRDITIANAKFIFLEHEKFFNG